MKVSVALPFYNNEATLADAIRSVFAQGVKDWELILLDDGSTDGSLRLARSVQDPRVRVISDGANRGLVFRLNQGVNLARAPLFARMDADDLMHPERLESQVRYLAQRDDIDLIGTQAYTVDLVNRPLGVRDSFRWMGFWGFVHPTVTGRTKWFKRNPYDPGYDRAEDTELWLRTQYTAKVATLPLPLFFYREHECFEWRKYWKGSVSVRRLLQRYGPAYKGRLWTYSQLAASWAKCTLYGASNVLGLEQTLVRRRGRSLTDVETRCAEAALAQILRTPVPGLEELNMPAFPGSLVAME